MTRKDYEQIARVLRQRLAIVELYQDEQHRQGGVAAIEAVVADMADMLKRDNINFDRTRFLKACLL